MSDDERRKLVSTEQSLEMDAEPRMPASIEGLETFTLGAGEDTAGLDDPREEEEEKDFSDADSFFDLPGDSSDDEQP
jgi:hypothetical protein